MAEDGVPEILQADRMGHAVPGMRGVCTHISDGMIADLLKALTARWKASLVERVAYSPHSPVAMLDDLLAPYRRGRRNPSRRNRAKTQNAPSG
ncbi:hypothetical protein Pth03_18390 [Planotetraspora thailandica]|uniref:Uncharacterized protein n=1 Tax=Planotetraspora thailandica TaxID=487172 RepID=A0A8J3XUV1_9ACTN|nr:hypothetical protein [Planotetraspora thailandica]GII53450.1 hypothetical protein Pth03_18390 [Planotetraspora thailandica]